MATIYQQPNPTGFSNCAILGSQENYYVPFLQNIGNWTQLRVSAYMSFCGTGSFQSPITPESITNSAPNLSWYWGIGNFTNSNTLGTLTPTSAGCNFIGSSSYGQPSTILSVGNVGPNLVNASTITSISNQIKSYGAAITNSSVSSQLFTFNMALFFPSSGSTGNVNYAVPLTMIFTIFNKGLTGQTVSMNINFDETGSQLNQTSFVDIPQLRIASMNLLGSGALTNASLTFNYTTGLTSSGGPLPLPDTVYFHSPFNNNFLRIHGLLVEKFF
jgi:hypothetical protein